jgi:hypothetical protein
MTRLSFPRLLAVTLAAALPLVACGDDTTTGAGGGAASSSGGDAPATGAGGAAASGGGGEGGGGGGLAAAGGGAPIDPACAPSFDDERLHLAVGAELLPGEDRTMCLRWTAPEEVEIVGFEGTLGPAGGHHALVLVQGEPTAPDGVGPCSEAEIMDATSAGDFQMIAGVSYESDGVHTAFPSAPVQIGLRVPAGQQVILDAHFVNPTAEAMTTCASVDFDRGDVVAALQFRTVLPEAQYGLVVPARDEVEVTYEEPIGASYRVAAASSHMHAGGRFFRMSVPETGRVLVETTEWAEPVPRIFDDERVVVDGAHTFRLECSFANETDADRRFPDEMCVGGLYVLPCSFPGAC